MELTMPAFEPGREFPARFTCDGANDSPPLVWTTPPDGTEAFAIVMEDPDAPGGTWVHWLLYDLPAAERELPEDIGASPTLPSGARQGRNDFHTIGYGGPCPPHGRAHRYYVHLYALDQRLGLKAGATRTDLQLAMRGHVLAEATAMSRYRRR